MKNEQIIYDKIEEALGQPHFTLDLDLRNFYGNLAVVYSQQVSSTGTEDKYYLQLEDHNSGRDIEISKKTYDALLEDFI